MDIRAQFRSGLYMANQSFSMLWYHKKLLLYFGIPALFSLALKLFAQKFFVVELDNPLELLYFAKRMFRSFLTLPEWIRFVSTASIHVGNMMLLTFFNAGLIYHANKVMQGETARLRTSLTACIPKLHLIIVWSLCLVGAQLVVFYTAESSPYIISLLMLVLAVALFLYTFFVLPLMILSEKNILAIAHDSVTMTRTFFGKIIGGEYWFGIVMLLVASLALIPWLLATPTITLFVGTFITEIVFSWIVSTAHVLFKMMLYREYEKVEHKKPRQIYYTKPV